MGRWIIQCDGTARPNPGDIAIGAVLTAPDGARHTISRVTGHRGDGNEAEARALIAALVHAQELGARSLAITCDSDVVVAHTVRGAATTVPHLAVLYAEARALLASFDDVDLRWVPRHKNTEADALARGALGLPVKKTHKPKRRR